MLQEEIYSDIYSRQEASNLILRNEAQGRARTLEAEIDEPTDPKFIMNIP